MAHPDSSGAPRARRVTIVDVARHAGVSTAAVSKVLRNAYGVSDSMRERVLHSMEQLEYRPHRPARGMRGRTYTVGMLVSDIENPFFDLLSDGAIGALAASGYELLIAPGGYLASEQVAAVEALIDHQMDGLILVAPVISRDDLERLARAVPVVVVGQHGGSDLLDTVAGDDHLGAAAVVDHLVELGHERIVFVANHREQADSLRPESVRLEGFLEAMRRHGLSDSAVVIDGSWSMDGGRDAAHAIEALDPRPTAVHAGADVVAFGVLSAWWDDGLRVPRDFSLVGYDNSRTSSIGPISLTTVDQSGREMGARAGELLLERIAGRTDAAHELLEPRLIPRATTARIAVPVQDTTGE
ncbi:MAG TPA: LacI family DNA-binding transcriptional regulator [Pseudolysinimonas sp.]|nr:LacI family DNA-binding transcriptional regulator [Pseudolysinimonas sp.]